MSVDSVEAFPGPMPATLPAAWRRLIDAYVDHVRTERYRARRTATAYRRTLALFAAHTRLADPAHVDPVHLAAFLDRRPIPSGNARGQVLADATRATYAVHVRTCFAWGHAVGLLPRDPFATVVPPQARLGPPRSLRKAQVFRLLAYARHDARLHAMAWLAYGAGLRVAEIAGARIEDLVLDDEPTLRVRGKGDRERIVPLHPEVARALAAVLAGRPNTGPILTSRVRPGRALGPKYVGRLLGQALRAAGVPASAHQLRHTFATLLLIEGQGRNLDDIGWLMGHEDPKTTKRYVRAYRHGGRQTIGRLPVPRRRPTGPEEA